LSGRPTTGRYGPKKSRRSPIGTAFTNSGNTFPQYYDAVGRYVSFGATLTF
jgi:hypothetical protein